MRSAKFASILQFTSLGIFLAIAKANGMTDEAWALAFQVSAVYSLSVVVWLWRTGAIVPRLFLSVTLFFSFGGLALFLKAPVLLQVLDATRETLLALCVALTGVVTTLTTKSGFVGVDPSTGDSQIKKYSWILTGLAVALFFYASSHRESLVHAGVIPYVSMIVAFRLVKRRVAKTKFVR